MYMYVVDWDTCCITVCRGHCKIHAMFYPVSAADDVQYIMHVHAYSSVYNLAPTQCIQYPHMLSFVHVWNTEECQHTHSLTDQGQGYSVELISIITQNIP